MEAGIAAGTIATGGALRYLSAAKTAEELTVEAAKYTVYHGYDTSGVLRYVGITMREPDVRFAEHANSGTIKSTLRYEPVQSGLSKDAARVAEQAVINQYGFYKNGDQLYNVINSIRQLPK